MTLCRLIVRKRRFKYTHFLPLLTGIILGCCAPTAAAQEDECARMAGTVGGLSTSPDVLEPFTLETLASTAERAHVTCAETTQRRRTVYTLNQAVYAFDGLQRYIEADSLTDLYFQRYADNPAYRDTGEDTFFRQYRARFAAWRSLFAMLRGDFLTAAHTNGQGEAFTNVLPLSRQIHLRLDLAYLYEQEERYQRALAIIDSIQAEHGAALQADSSLHTTYARVLLEGAELLGKQVRSDSTGTLTSEQIAPLEEAERRLVRSEALYAMAGERLRQSEAAVILGDVRATLRQTPMPLTSAIDSARAWLAHRSVIYGLWRRGRHYLRDGDPKRAEADFIMAQALSDSIGLGEYARYLAFDLGRAYEDQGRFDVARTAFDDASRLSAGFTGAYLRERVQHHLRAIDGKEARRTMAMVLSLALLAVVLSFILLFVIARQRKRALAPQSSPPATGSLVVVQETTIEEPKPIRPTPTEPTLPAPDEPAPPASDEYLPLHPEEGGADLFLWRTEAVRFVLERPDAAHAMIDDPVLKGKLRRGLEINIDLFQVVEAIEEGITGEAFEGTPGNTVGSYLRREFKNRHIPWPMTPQAWRRYFAGRG